MRVQNLDGTWMLYYFLQGEKNITAPGQLLEAGVPSVEAQVPGNVELDLSQAGILPKDLYQGTNIRAVQQYEQYEWWYKREFPTPHDTDGKKVTLRFNGVDCLATYWLNGQEIGQSDNMFIEHEFNITGKLKADGMNTMAVRLRSAVLEGMKKPYDPSLIAQATNMEQLWIRKANHSYGWDIMPRAVSAGLWRSVELRVHDTWEIDELYFYTLAAKAESAQVGIFYQLATTAQRLPELTLKISGSCGQATFQATRRVRFIAGKLWIRIEAPQLWWPLGYGPPHMYRVTTQLVAGDKVLASREDTLGIRTVELVRTNTTSPKAPGEFVFKINSVPILCKGSNWLPADVFHSRDKARIEKILSLFVELKCNMVRSWGGSVYEDHAFFDFCDQHGLMVWQDFAMACAFHPQAPEFLEAIRNEAAAVVKKLRNHPSLVVWSGDNEVDEFMFGSGLDPACNRISREVLPQVMFHNDPHRPFLPSSPYYAPEVIAAGNPDLMPERHLWGPRGYYKNDYYLKSTAHFVSETGFMGMPNLSSMRKFIDQDHLWPWPDNEQWIAHCTESMGKNGPYAYRVKLFGDQIKALFGSIPDNLEDYILASQVFEAEALKTCVENTRLKKWRKTGILWWNMMDGWPQFSDSVVDYYFGKKLAWHYLKRVQDTVCVMIDEPVRGFLAVVAGNDSRENVRGSYRIVDADTGKAQLKGSFKVKANQNAALGKIKISARQQRLFLIEWEINGRKYGNHYLLGQPLFSLEQYKKWLKKIAALPEMFDADKVGR